MGTTLTGTTPQDTYDSLIKVTDNGPLSGSLKTLTDGLGNDSALALSTGAASVTGTLAVSSGITSTGANTMLSASTSTEGLVVRGGSSIGTPTVASGQILIGQTATYRGSIAYDDNAGYLYIDNLYNNNAGNIYFRTKTQGTAVEALTILGSGNVGIGTSSPPANTNLTVLGNFESGFYRNVTSGNRGYFLHLGANTASGTLTNAASLFGTLNSGDADGSLEIQTRSSGTLATRVSITSAGVVELAQGQIKFPATQVPSADVNTLDDYEEGTWTPVLVGAGTAGTYEQATTYATYTKIGRQVTVNCYVQLAGSITGGGTGYAIITGIPFAKSANQQTSGSVFFSGVDFTGSFVSIIFQAASSSSNLYFSETVDNGAAIDLPISGFSANNVFSFSITYNV